MIPQFGVCYDPVTNVVTKMVMIDIGSDSEDNVKSGLIAHLPPGQVMLFVPIHQSQPDDLNSILDGLGITTTAPPGDSTQ